MNKSTWGLLIFATGVIMLLLRPYIIYQLTEQQGQANNPVKVYSLLQRLVTKKDEHHELQGMPATEADRLKIDLRIPLAIPSYFYPCILSLFAFLSLLTRRRPAASFFSLPPENDLSYLASCLRI